MRSIASPHFLLLLSHLVKPSHGGFSSLGVARTVKGCIATRMVPSRFTRETRCYGFFKNLIEQAFENDSNLRQDDKRTGQLDDADDEGDAAFVRRNKLTETQEKWRKLTNNQSSLTLASSKVLMDFYLTGIPNKDPSNDLFGSRVNISSRDRRIGLAVPEAPTVRSICVEFLEDNKCSCLSDTPLTSGESEGDWKLSETGSQVRFRIQISGYTRTIETKGTIQNVYWSSDEEQVRKTSSTYSIPAGWLYGEADLKSTRGQLQWENGILKVEQTVGLMRASKKMVPCGTFTARALEG